MIALLLMGTFALVLFYVSGRCIRDARRASREWEDWRRETTKRRYLGLLEKHNMGMSDRTLYPEQPQKPSPANIDPRRARIMDRLRLKAEDSRWGFNRRVEDSPPPEDD